MSVPEWSWSSGSMPAARSVPRAELNLRRAATEGAQPSRKVGHNLPGGKAELRAAKLSQKRASRATAGDSAFNAEAIRDALIHAFAKDGERARFETVALSRYARDVARKIGSTLGFTAAEVGSGGRNEKRRLVLTRRRGASGEEDDEDEGDDDADADGDGEEATSDCDDDDDDGDSDDADGDDGGDGCGDEFDGASGDGTSDNADASDGDSGEAPSALHPDAVAAASAVCDRHSSAAAGDGVRSVASALRALRRRRQQARVSARASAAPRGKSRGQVWEKPGAAEPEDGPAAAAPGAGAQEARFIGFVAEGAEEAARGVAEAPQLCQPEASEEAAELAQALERAHLSSSQPPADAPAPMPADWEAHTRGIGSKLLAKWGFSGGALGAAGRPLAAPGAQPALMEQVVKRDKAGLGAAR
jgi:hypothetical protein